VSFKDSTPMVTVDGVTVALDSVSAIAQPSSPTQPTTTTPAV
jgi:hypothetical protein